jgi:hypothetical protein
LAAEVTRATTAEGTLTTNLATETATRGAADVVLTNNVSTLTTGLSTEVTNRTNADLLKEDLVNKSVNVTTDGASDTKYPSVKATKTYVDGVAGANTTALNAETAARIAADNALTTNLATEVSTRTTAVSTLTSSLASEVTRATAAEIAEATRAGLAESTLTNNLAAEVTRATAAELTKELLINKSTSVTIDGASDTMYSSAKSVKTYVDASTLAATTALNSEISRATAAENLVAANLLLETSRATTAENLKENTSNKSTDGTMATNSDVKFPTEKAVRTYVSNNSSVAAIRSISSNYTVTMSDYTILCDNSGGTFTLTLPNVSTSAGKIFVICKIDDSTNVLSFSPALRFSLNTSIPNLNYTKTFKVQSDGTSWFIIN